MLYLWEKECYYNERGNIILNLPGKIETNNYINIILTGISRAGKSTLINKYFISKTCFKLSGIRFYDTSGLTIIKDKNKKKYF